MIIELPQRVVIPQGSDRFPLFSTQHEYELSSDLQNQATTFIEVPSNIIVHQVYELNLDSDPGVEQIIAHKFRDSGEEAITLTIIDYDSEREAYFFSWQGETSLSNIRSLNLYAEDLTQDGQLEIVVQGTNLSGNQTLDIYYRRNNEGFGLQYRTVLSIQADIAVEIQESDSSRSFSNIGSLNAGTSAIQSLNRNLESENPLDMLQSTYSWRAEDERFVLQSIQNISGLEIEQNQLAELFAGDISGFYNFVDGLWQQNDSLQIISFSRRSNSIQLATSDRQLHFHWLSSTRWGITGSFWATIQNEIISNDRQRIQISIIDLNTIVVQLTGESASTFWSGTYTRLVQNEEFLPRSTHASSEDIQLYPHNISGLYQSNDDREILFAPPNVTLRGPNEERRGGFVIYTLNGLDILQILFLNEFNAYVESEAYVLQFQETTNNRQIQRRILLQQAELSSLGAALLNTESIQYEQVTILEDG